MITIRTISGTVWTAITTAGQQGTVWTANVIRGNGRLFISHSIVGTPRSRYGLPLMTPRLNNDVMILGPDSGNDIFYARCQRSNGIVKIAVDVI